MSGIEPVRLPNKGRSGKDTEKARELGGDIEGVAGAISGAVRTNVVNQVTGVERPIGVKYSFVNQAWDDFSLKSKLAASAGRGAYFSVSERDIEGYKNAAYQNAQQRFDQWCLSQFDPQVPGQLAHLERINPALVQRLTEHINDEAKMLADIKRVSLMAPRTPDEAKLRFLMDQGMLDGYKEALSAGPMSTLMDGKQGPPDARSLFYRWATGASYVNPAFNTPIGHAYAANGAMAPLGDTGAIQDIPHIPRPAPQATEPRAGSGPAA